MGKKKDLGFLEKGLKMIILEAGRTGADAEVFKESLEIAKILKAEVTDNYEEIFVDDLLIWWTICEPANA